jgi:hypothetical protein
MHGWLVESKNSERPPYHADQDSEANPNTYRSATSAAHERQAKTEWDAKQENSAGESFLACSSADQGKDE